MAENEAKASNRLVAGRYGLLRELGRGGMGVVWLAEDQLVGRMVAVKELRTPHGVSGPERSTYQRRALQEASSAARIRHPGAVTLYDILPATATDDAIYIIMEFIDGPTLAKVIQATGRLPDCTVASYGLQLLSVLAAAHALGIVHRDLKPANIMVTADGQARLTDFGIAHVVGDTRLTRSGVMGTQAYMAPELFDSQPIGPVADLWSLGATLCHAVEGHGPFDRDTTSATLRAILLDDLPVPRCSPALAAAITGMLQRDPARRATIDWASAWLAQAADPATTPASSAPAQPPAGLHVTAQPQVTAQADPATGSQTAMATPPTEPDWEQARTTRAPLSPAIRLPSSPPAQPAQAHGLSRLIGVPGARRGRLIGAVAAATVLAIGASVAGGFLASGGTVSIGGLRATITLPAKEGGDSLAVNADATMVAASTGSSNLSAAGAVWDTAGGGKTTSLPPDSSHLFVAFSSDGRTLALDGGAGAIDLWSTADHKVVATLSPPSSGTSFTFIPSAGTFSPTGNTLAVTADGHSVQLWDTSSRALTYTLGTPSSGITVGTGAVAFSGDGKTVAAGSDEDGTVRLWDVGTRGLIATVPAAFGPGLYGPARWVALSPDGSLLAIAGTGKQASGVRLWDVATRTWLATMTDPHTRGASGIAFSPDGRTFAVADANGSVYLWDVGARKIATSQFVAKQGVNAVAFSPDGTTLATSEFSNHVDLWNVTGA